jgi:hypothetical protein
MPISMRGDHGIPAHSRQRTARHMTWTCVQLVVAHAFDNNFIEPNPWNS